jgi:hypothetical protein
MTAAVHKMGRSRSAMPTNAQLMRLVRFPAIRRAISGALASAIPEKVAVHGGSAYVRFRLADPRSFHPALFATIPVGNRGTLIVIGTPKSAVKKPRELEAFIRRMGRGMKTEARRSLMYQLRTAGIIGGAETQAVLVPRARVLSAARMYLGSHAGRVAANPILATIGFNPDTAAVPPPAKPAAVVPAKPAPAPAAPAPVTAKNPGAVSINVPFRDGQKITPARMRQWLASLPNNPITRLIKGRFEKGIKQYKRFHLGSEPTSFTYRAIPMGSQGSRITDVDMVVSEGKEWAAPYQVPKTSGKYDPNVEGRYIHAHGESKMEIDIKKAASTKKLPERFHTADGKFVGVVPAGTKVKIGAWYTG